MQETSPNILFITANRIGDAILSTGVLNHLVEQYPNARITIAAGPVAADIFRATPHMHTFISMKKKPHHGHWIELWKQCHNTKWDIIVDLRNSLVSRLLSAKHKAYRPKHRSEQHRVVDNAQALNLVPPPAPKIWLDDVARDEANALVPAQKHPILALGPTANWAAKQWSGYNFAELAKKLMAPQAPFANSKILLLAAASEVDQLDPLLRALPAERIIKAVGCNLLTAAACLEKCRLFIGNDSGLMHLSAAVGTPTLGLFGPGFENVYGPWGDKTAFVRTDESTATLLERCEYPGAFYPNLMTGLSIDKALDAALTLLERTE